MSDSRPSLEGCAERRRVRWATFVAVALDLLLPSLLASDASHHDLGSRLAALTTFITAGVGAVLGLHAPWRPVGVGLVRGSAFVFVFVLVVMPLTIFAMSSFGLM
jgi:hypothetical protein